MVCLAIQNEGLRSSFNGECLRSGGLQLQLMGMEEAQDAETDAGLRVSSSEHHGGGKAKARETRPHETLNSSARSMRPAVADVSAPVAP